MLNSIYTLFDNFGSGYNRLYRILQRVGFDFTYDPETEEHLAVKGDHRFLIEDSVVSYTGPLGEKYDLTFREMREFLRNPEAV